MFTKTTQLVENLEMWFGTCLLVILIFTTVSLCKPTKQDGNGSEDEDYDHEDGYRDETPVVESKAPPDDGSPECHKIFDTKLKTKDVDIEEQPTEHDKKISGEAENDRQNRLSQSKRHYSLDLSKAKDKQNVGDKLAEIEEEGAELNYDGAAAGNDWKTDYIEDREINNKFNIQPVQHKNIGNKKDKHWFDFYRNRRHVQNMKMQRANAKGTEDEETAIKRHIKKLTSDELELLLKSLSNEKRILLQSIIDSDEKRESKREITKKAAADEENEESNMMMEGGARQSKSAVHETKSDCTQKSLVTMTAKTFDTRSADINEQEDKMDSVADAIDSEYDYNESAMLQSVKAETKRDAREEYDSQSDDPDDDDENVKLNSDRRISNKRLHKRTADARGDSLAESMKSLEESFAKTLNFNSEMVPLVRVKRTHDNGQNYTRNNISRLEVEEDNELFNNEANEADNITSRSQLQASLVSAEGENVLDSIEVGEPDIAYTINDETPEVKNWNLINCSCVNVSFEAPANLQDDDPDAKSDPESHRSAKESVSNHPIHLAIDEQKYEGQVTPSLKLIENNSSEKVSMYQDSEVVDPVSKPRGLQRYKRIRRVKQP